jgi:Omp85 superfamily domain
MKTTLLYIIVEILALVFICNIVSAQSKKKISLKDSLDQKLDLSDYIIDANGFVPVPIIITEPALGGFGFGLVPVFIKKRPAYEDVRKGKVIRTPVAPDITGAFGFYTLNKTWGAGAFRSGTLVKSRIKYLVGGAYFDVNLSFYRTLEQLGEKEFEFNIRTFPILLQAIKRIGLSKLYAGFRYTFLSTEIKYAGDPLLQPGFVKPIDSSSKVSQLGGVLEVDTRDNIFTPDRGMKLHYNAIFSDDAIGSDYDFWKMEYYGYGYTKLTNNLVAGLRVEGQQAFDDPPFYLLPFLNMRGLPAVRYQGNATLLTEGELRWDFVNRWSIMAFGGAGKAFDDWDEFDEAKLVGSIGTGLRYLLARKFKLRVGVDVAKGSDSWAYYIVFGSSWRK